MTAPFAPRPQKPLVAILVGLVVMTIAMPFGRQEGWVGWTAFLVVLGFALMLWGILIWRIVEVAIDWWQNRKN